MSAPLLAIDLGTSSVKALVVDEIGRTLGAGSAAYPIHHPLPGHAEQDPAAWWHALQLAVRQALDATATPDIAAIGLAGQMHGTVLLDERDRLLGSAIIWPDRRSHRQVQEITAGVGAERLIELTGSPLATGFQAATVRWLQQEQPDLWQRVRRLLTPKGYLLWRLTGQFAADPSDAAGTLLLDVHARRWCGEILDFLAIPASVLPAIQPAHAVAGALTSTAAGELGVAAGTPVVTGAADTASSLLGAGITQPGQLLLTLSTGGQLVLPAAEVTVDRRGRAHTFCSALAPDGKGAGWYHMGATLAAGLSLRWLRDAVFDLGGAYERLTALAEPSPPGARGLLFLPYLAGERTPHMDSLARGAFLGLTLEHGQGDLVRAVLEGVSFACLDAYQVLTELVAPPALISLAGGGAASPLWQQIVADVFGLPVRRLETAEQSARGAALLAGMGAGLFDAGPWAAATEAPRWASYGATIEPNPDHHVRYQALHGQYRAAYAANRAIFHALAVQEAAAYAVAAAPAAAGAAAAQEGAP